MDIDPETKDVALAHHCNGSGGVGEAGERASAVILAVLTVS